MTALEFMKLMHPNEVNDVARGGCFGCPCDYGIELEEPLDWCYDCDNCWGSKMISWNSEADTKLNK